MDGHDVQMIKHLLAVAGALEVAAGVYGAEGRVVKVKRGTRQVRALDDYQRLQRWLRYENAKGANVWIRPGASSHPVVMLDDLPTATAAAIARKYRGCAVETSASNSQALIVCTSPLSREERQDMARVLGRLVGADPGAVSEPRWYRLPGYRNRKPGKPFQTRLVHLSYDAAALDPAPHLDARAPLRGATVFAPCRGVDKSGGAGGSFTFCRRRHEPPGVCFCLPLPARRRVSVRCRATDRGSRRGDRASQSPRLCWQCRQCRSPQPPLTGPPKRPPRPPNRRGHTNPQPVTQTASRSFWRV